MSIQLEKAVELPPRQKVSGRTARESDYPVIRRLLRDSYRPYAHLMPGEIHRRFITDLVDIEHHTRYGQVMVAEVDDRIHGSVALYPPVSTPGFDLPVGWASVRALAVSRRADVPEVADRLIVKGEQRARAEGASAFAIRIAPFMTKAMTHYEAMGYRRVPRYDINLGHIYGFTRWKPTMLLTLTKQL